MGRNDELMGGDMHGGGGGRLLKTEVRMNMVVSYVYCVAHSGRLDSGA